MTSRPVRFIVATPDLRVLLRDPVKLTADRWCLRRMAMHDLKPLLPVMVRKTYAFQRSAIQKLGKLRVAIPGAIRRYVTPDLEGTVKPGYIIISGASFYIAREDADWFHQLHGGSDSDDGFVIIPITGNLVLLYRNPNQLGEWSVMRIQDSDVQTSMVNQLQLPIAQRLNWKRDDMDVNMIMNTVANFWDHLAEHNVEVDRAMLPRIPERVQDMVKTKDGWLTRLFEYTNHHLSLADEAIEEYSRIMPIAEELITAPRSAYYELAKELRSEYGRGIRAARNQNVKYLDKHPDDLEDIESDLQRRIEKVHGRIRGQLGQLDSDAQKLVVRDLMRVCYLEMPGVTVGDGYVLTQANDGILGISSSRGGRSRGTWDIMMDLLVDQGYGRRLVQGEDSIQFVTPYERVEYTADSIVVRVIGGWQSVQAEGIASENERVALAYQMMKNADHLNVQDQRIYHEGQEFGRIVRPHGVRDGKYQILTPGRPGKSLVLHIAECTA